MTHVAVTAILAHLEMVQAERAEPTVVFERWKAGRRAALAALRGADPQQPIPWVTNYLKPATLATPASWRPR